MWITITEESYEKILSNVLSEVTKGQPKTEKDLLETAIRDGLRKAGVRVAK